MVVAFIRHKFPDFPDFVRCLWSNTEIAIHYEPIASMNPDDYHKKSDQNAIRRLQKFCDEGVLIGAVYGDIYQSQMLIGEIHKGSQVIYRSEKKSGVTKIFKIVKLQNARVISLRDYPILGAIQPQRGTLTRWPKAQTILQSIYHREPLTLDQLDPSRLEVLCQEYLRAKGKLKALLAPIGRTLQDVDIAGIDQDGVKVFAQVTHSENPRTIINKLNTLKNYAGHRTKLIFFGPDSQKRFDTDVEYIPLELVFSELEASEEMVYRHLINNMLGLP